MRREIILGIAAWLWINSTIHAEATVQIDRVARGKASATFQFPNIPPPSTSDAGNLARPTLVLGEADPNAAAPSALQDGKLPENEDQPSANFFLAGRNPGRLLFDFGKALSLQQINSYSWHPGARADQRYTVYVPTQVLTVAEAKNSAAGADLGTHWRQVAAVDTRSDDSAAAQIGVSITDSQSQPIAITQFVLLVIEPTQANVAFSQTFFSEIDFIDGNAYPAAVPHELEQLVDDLLIKDSAANTKYTLRFDTTEVPELREWVQSTLMPACEQWYPRIVAALSSQDYAAPDDFRVVFRSGMRGVAYTSGQDIFCAGPWYKANLQTEAVGSVIHELVHVAQQYGRSGGQRPPGWLVEGIADHIRWYQFEPSTKRRKMNWEQSNFDDAYFPSATFLDYIVQEIDPTAINRINAACRQGRYSDDLWQTFYNKSAEQIWAEAKAAAQFAEAQVVVYGSTPGGFCAAIAAAREGASVILLEPTDHVGGLNTGGLSHCDSNQMVRSTVRGLFEEWHTRVVKDYIDRGLDAPYAPDVKDQSRWTFEPHVAMRVTMQMLDEAEVKVITESYLKSVTKDGPRITSLVTQQGTFAARVFVDGTYEGDLMAAAGVDWTIGREGRAEYGESLAGKQYPKQTMNINGFDDHGNLLPLITSGDAGPDEEGDQNVMTYSFRLCLTDKPDNRVPLPQPTNYDPARFEVLRRGLQAGVRVGFDLYPLPGGKLDGNNSIGGQFSLGLVGGDNNWHSADAAGRREIWEAYKQYTLEFYHFLTTDPAVPEEVRNQYAKLGLCKDEFASYDHFSPALYVRESRRMKGMAVISQKDILDSPSKDDPIAVSSFPIDSHDCQRVALEGGGVVNEGTIFPVRREHLQQGYAYHVPYRSIVPQPEQCDNLLVPVALSCTHVGISSLRIEGTWMIIGQSAGIAAALAANSDVSVQELPYPQLRQRLLAQGQVLQLPDVSELPGASENSSTSVSIDVKNLSGIILDDASAELTGGWSQSTNFKPHIGHGYSYSGDSSSDQKGDGSAVATFRFNPPRSGEYQLLMAYSAHETRATEVPVVVTSGGNKKEFAVDQTQPLPSGQHFKLVGNVQLEGGVETTITISNSQTAGFVIVDALQLLPTGPRR